MQNKFFDKTKIILNGVILAVTLIVIGLTYSYVTFDETVSSKSSVLDGQFFQILKTFRDEKINFANIDEVLHKTFERLQDTRSIVNSDLGRGRVNPFAK